MTILEEKMPMRVKDNEKVHEREKERGRKRIKGNASGEEGTERRPKREERGMNMLKGCERE